MGWTELWGTLGPGLAGAVFGGGWWFWVDAVVCSSIAAPFVHYLPGIFASIAALMFNCVKRDELQDYSPYDDGEGCRSRTWLFLAYVISFVSLAGSVGLLAKDALEATGPSTWTGVAGVLQCTFILIRYRSARVPHSSLILAIIFIVLYAFAVVFSGLMYWTSRTSADG